MHAAKWILLDLFLGCVDRDKECAGKAKQGFCELTSASMNYWKNFCRKSCNLCSGKRFVKPRELHRIKIQLLMSNSNLSLTRINACAHKSKHTNICDLKHISKADLASAPAHYIPTCKRKVLHSVCTLLFF